MKLGYRKIGTIHSPFKTTEGMPIQPIGAQSIKGTIDIHPDFDHFPADRVGWLEDTKKEAMGKKSDGRFD